MNGGVRLQSVEIYNPVTNTICSLPELPEARYYHTQDGELACGGFGDSSNTFTPYTCVKWSSESGSWTQSHTLLQVRIWHVSWATEDGVYLMGGAPLRSTQTSTRTTELVKEDGSVEDGFGLIYDSR